MIYSSDYHKPQAPMLSYQHSYHAGNFADVFKHIILSRILAYIGQKEKPLLYLETHSGRGLYDLQDSHARKTGEFHSGVGLLWEARNKAPDLLSPYLGLLQSLNPDDKLRYYPGSPYCALSLLRNQDRLLFSEMHSLEFSHLTQISRQGKRVFFNQGDGLQTLKAELPPIERRACVFVDPSFEIKEEYKTIPRALGQAFERFATGIYGLWYPIVDNRYHQQLIRGLQSIPAEKNKMLQIELYLSQQWGQGMRGCGLWIINPPYSLAAESKVVLDFLCSIFNKGQSSYLINAL